ncbi:MAG: methyltransferase [Planctomycetes bacterium]|nr:methyltransferase [Planctomycetota bacterium]
MRDSRQIVLDALNHRQPPRLPVDCGGTACSGMHAKMVADLRECLGLEKRPVKIFDVCMMPGYIDDDLAELLELDVTLAMPPAVNFGYPLDKWKEWRTPWGQVVLVPELFAFSRSDNGDIFIYPQGDTGVPPSGHMPTGSYYFDGIVRKTDFDDDHADPADNLEEYQILSPAALRHIAKSAEEARAAGRAVVGVMPGGSLNNINAVPGPGLKHPKGIRDFAEWYLSLAARPEYLRKVFEGQTEVALENLKLIHQTVGDAAYDVAYICGADFGAQEGLICSEAVLRDLLLPCYRKLTGWVHEHTPWKTMKHCCGAVEEVMEFFIEAGFDIINPVQCSAAGMDPRRLKDSYGTRMVFWGGGVETQSTLAFGSPEAVRREVLERCRVFSPGGGFIFNAVHNIQPDIPLVNVLAMFNAVREFNGQPPLSGKLP